MLTTYVKEELKKLGGIVKNPMRVPKGETYKQNEVFMNLVKKQAKNMGK